MKIKESWQEERQSVYLYRGLSAREPEPRVRRMFDQLALAATQQADHWEKLAKDRAEKLPAVWRPGLRARLVAGLIRLLGPRAMLPVLAAMKIRGLSVYTQPDRVESHPLPVSGAEPERRHRSISSGGNLRAAVFGINDGLISNASLIFGVAGASLDNRVVLLSGVAGLMAGAFSMAAGEYISMRSQREMYEYQIGLEKQELQEYPQEEAMELALIYEARGLDAEQARRTADTIIADPERALDTLTREELGLNPDELGSPWHVAGASFTAFALGALIPLLPLLLLSGREAIFSVMVLTAFALFAAGAVTSLFTGRSAILSGLRMVFVGALAGTATWCIGYLLGVGAI